LVSQETAAVERSKSEQLIGIERGRTEKIEDGKSKAWQKLKSIFMKVPAV
jgi:hypothetical protein